MFEHLTTIIIVAIVLGIDAFSLSLGLGLQGVRRRYELRFTFVVIILHIFMPLLGLTLGLAVGKFLGVWAARIGALILAYIGINFLYQGYKETKIATYSFKVGQDVLKSNNSITDDSFKTLFILGISVSVDALTVGFSLGTFQVPILITITLMGIVAGIMTWLGFIGGRLFSRAVGSYAQMIGGLILLGLAIKLVL